MTFVLYPERNHPEIGLDGDHAYWISGLKVRDGAELGRIDAFSHGFGVGDPPISQTRRGIGTLEGGNLGTLAYTSQARTWGDTPTASKRNALDIDATGISAATIHVDRARVGCGAEVNVKSDEPITLVLAGCGRRVAARG